MAPTALVTGGTGLVGREVIKAFESKKWKVVGTGNTRASPPSIVKLDLLLEDEIEKALDEVKPDVVVHCAANRFPDACTKNPSLANAINSKASQTLAQHTLRRGILLVYISTDYVFPGRPGEAPYKPDAEPSPTNIYGQSKRDGEIGVLKETEGIHDDRVLGVVLRVPLLYGKTSDENDPSVDGIHMLVKQIWESQSIKEGQAKIKTDDYAQRYPTATQDVARVIVDISKLYLQTRDKELPRILHFSGQEAFTRYQMAELLADILGLPMDGIERWDPTKDVNVETQRPYDTHLDTSALKELGIDDSAVDFKGWWRWELNALRR